MESKHKQFYTEADTYQTGRTEPPKHYQGIIALLLVLVILLSGISTALSFLNLRLYVQLNAQETTPPVAFSRAEVTQQTVNHSEDMVLPSLGLCGTVIPSVYQRYYKLPNGFYITQVLSGGLSAKNGLLTGDIITAVNGNPITDQDSVRVLLEDAASQLELTLYRSGSELSVSIPLES